MRWFLGFIAVLCGLAAASPLTAQTPPSDEPTTPTQGATPAVEGVDPAAEGVDPSGEAATPAAEGVDPSGEAATPAAEGVDPSGEAATPAAEGVDPSSEAATPAAEGVEGVDAEELAALQAAMNQDAAEKAATEPVPQESMTVGQTLQSLNPNIALILDVAAAYFSTDEPLQSGGHDPTRTGFNLQQLEMSINASVDPYLRFDANIVFAEFGVEVEEAYFTTLSFPANLQLRGGQFLTQFGRINASHPHAWSFADQPLVIGKFLGSEGSRGLGAELSWLTPLPWYVMVVGSATNPWGECCARSFFGGDDIPLSGPQDLLYTTALKQFFALSDDWSLFWGLSGQFGANPTGQGNRTEIYATDIYLRWRPLASQNRMAVSLSAEGMTRRRQVPGDVLVDYGGFTQAVWSISPRWETGVRYEYVTGVEGDPLEEAWFEDRQRTSAQVTFYPSHFSRFRLQGNYDAPEWRSEPIWGAFLTAEVVVGAHGSHNF